MAGSWLAQVSIPICIIIIAHCSIFMWGFILAVADKKERDKAVLVLGKWLSKQSHLTEDDHLKIWKALYYCFWMSDKPLVQK